MDDFSAQLNDVLISTYQSIGKLEEKMLQSVESNDLSINELHLIEAIGKEREGGTTISDLAQEFEITLPSVTVAVKKLEKKGYVQKRKSESDGRMVHVVLTRAGRRMEMIHNYFHRKMITAVLKTMREEEKQQLYLAIQRLDAFIKQSILDIEHQKQEHASRLAHKTTIGDDRI